MVLVVTFSIAIYLCLFASLAPLLPTCDHHTATADIRKYSFV